MPPWPSDLRWNGGALEQRLGQRDRQRNDTKAPFVDPAERPKAQNKSARNQLEPVRRSSAAVFIPRPKVRILTAIPR
jgi:hypothetical protein